MYAFFCKLKGPGKEGMFANHYCTKLCVLTNLDFSKPVLFTLLTMLLQGFFTLSLCYFASAYMEMISSWPCSCPKSDYKDLPSIFDRQTGKCFSYRKDRSLNAYDSADDCEKDGGILASLRHKSNLYRITQMWPYSAVVFYASGVETAKGLSMLGD